MAVSRNFAFVFFCIAVMPLHMLGKNVFTAYPWFSDAVPHSARPPSSLGVEQTVFEHAHSYPSAFEHVDMEIIAPLRSSMLCGTKVHTCMHTRLLLSLLGRWVEIFPQIVQKGIYIAGPPGFCHGIWIENRMAIFSYWFNLRRKRLMPQPSIPDAHILNAHNYRSRYFRK